MFRNGKLHCLMFVHVLAGQSANVGVSPGFQYEVLKRLRAGIVHSVPNNVWFKSSVYVTKRLVTVFDMMPFALYGLNITLIALCV